VKLVIEDIAFTLFCTVLMIAIIIGVAYLISLVV